MKKQEIWYKCPICGNIIELVQGDPKRIRCCGKEMEVLESNKENASPEKHIPVYEKRENKIIVKVGKIDHPMEKEHSILWIAQVTDKQITKVNVEGNASLPITLPYEKGAKLYAYCNQHGLWKTIIN